MKKIFQYFGFEKKEEISSTDSINQSNDENVDDQIFCHNKLNCFRIIILMDLPIEHYDKLYNESTEYDDILTDPLFWNLKGLLLTDQKIYNKQDYLQYINRDDDIYEVYEYEELLNIFTICKTVNHHLFSIFINKVNIDDDIREQIKEALLYNDYSDDESVSM